MTIPKTPPPLRPTIPGDKDHERLDRALEKPVKDEWVDDFIERLNCTIGDLVRKRRREACRLREDARWRTSRPKPKTRWGNCPSWPRKARLNGRSEFRPVATSRYRFRKAGRGWHHHSRAPHRRSMGQGG